MNDSIISKDHSENILLTNTSPRFHKLISMLYWRNYSPRILKRFKQLFCCEDVSVVAYQNSMPKWRFLALGKGLH